MIQLTPPGILSVFTAATILCILAGVLWWLTRRRPRPIPFPLLQHLRLPPSPRFHLIWQAPQAGIFICFMSAAALAAALALKPWWLHEAAPESTTAPNYLWIIDLSPSVSARISHGAYSRLLQAYASTLPPASSIAILTSSDREPAAAIRPHEFQGLTQDFHRAGFIGTELLAELSSQLTEYTATIIFTDGAPESWPIAPATLTASSFYQAHNVQFQLIAPQQSARENIFISWFESHRSPELTLKLTLTRRLLQPGDPAPATGGTLMLRRGWISPDGPKLDAPPTTVPYALPAGSDELTLTIPAPAATEPPAGASPIIHLEIKPEIPDLITLDNHYYAAITPPHHLVLIGPSLGESMVGDPLHPHLMSLPLLGFSTTRLDSWNPAASAGAAATRATEAMLFVASPAASQDSLTCTPAGANLQHVVVLPARSWVPPSALCACAQRLLELASPPTKLPCPATLTSPAELAYHLLDHSFDPLITSSANLTSELPVVLRRRRAQASAGLDITVTVWPLDPYHSGDHSLTTHGNLIPVLKRILASHPDQPPPLTAATGSDLTNVPRRESILAPAAINVPPPQHAAPSARAPQEGAEANPLPMLMLLMVSAVMLVELSFYGSAAASSAQASPSTSPA